MTDLVHSSRIEVFKKASETIFHIHLEHDHNLLADCFLRFYWYKLQKQPIDDRCGFVVKRFKRLSESQYAYVQRYLLTRVGIKSHFNGSFNDGDQSLWKMLGIRPLIHDIKERFESYGYTLTVIGEDLRIQIMYGNSVHDDLCCPITYAKFVDPVIASDGHTYERVAIEKLINTQHTIRSPLTREIIEPTVYPNHAMRKRIIESEVTLTNKRIRS